MTKPVKKFPLNLAKKPDFFKSYNISFIPKHIPFELIDLRHVFLVIGEVGASLLHPEAKKPLHCKHSPIGFLNF